METKELLEGIKEQILLIEAEIEARVVNPIGVKFKAKVDSFGLYQELKLSPSMVQLSAALSSAVPLVAM